MNIKKVYNSIFTPRIEGTTNTETTTTPPTTAYTTPEANAMDVGNT